MSQSGFDPECQKINESAYDYQTHSLEKDKLLGGSDKCRLIHKSTHESADQYQAHSCTGILKNKPQINADERRLIASFYAYNWLSCFSMTPDAPRETRIEAFP